VNDWLSFEFSLRYSSTALCIQLTLFSACDETNNSLFYVVEITQITPAFTKCPLTSFSHSAQQQAAMNLAEFLELIFFFLELVTCKCTSIGKNIFESFKTLFVYRCVSDLSLFILLILFHVGAFALRTKNSLVSFLLQCITKNNSNSRRMTINIYA
jgi:hypothetical protein